EEGEGTHSPQRICDYAQAGYTPFWMQKCVAKQWYLVDRWETPVYDDVFDMPETDWYLWPARLVDDIEKEGRMYDFKSEGKAFNPYRERIIAFACSEAFGTTHPTKEGVFLFEIGLKGCADVRQADPGS
ncbi:MAG: hypothetical protein ACKPKO_42870, partial [Candidatus Fonsibacter sp.]